MPYDAGKAWLRATIYFAACWLIAVPTEAFTLLGVRVTAVDGLWWWATGIALVVAVVGYWVVWPMGTTTNGRELRLGWAALFGVIWGASEGVLLIAAWTVAGGHSVPPPLRRTDSPVACAVLGRSGRAGPQHP